ncbi:DUF5665 domain-containing protein [Pseudogemmobacter sp. W21_MBD1_M6]|uniref:DUF5665 domain-containing protein n=1 Tax=Pseudogemmobacter sp. W21_MBD1_M6 TaxID=3240271 RepID=UPI003F96AEA6
MNRKPKTPAPDTEPMSDIEALRREIARLNDNRYLRIQSSVPRMMGHTFLRGLAMGLGTVVGATILVSILAFVLAQINFIPIIGDWAAQIAEQIQVRD